VGCGIPVFERNVAYHATFTERMMNHMKTDILKLINYIGILKTDIFDRNRENNVAFFV